MAVRVTIKKNAFPEVKKEIPRSVAVALMDVGYRVRTTIKSNIRLQHLIRTGNYINSWVVERDTPNSVVVLSKGAPYGAYLEYGHRANPGQVFPVIKGNTLVGFRRIKKTTTWVPARPHVSPAAVKWRGKPIADAFAKALQSAIARGIS